MLQLADVIAAIGVVLNAIPQAIMAMAFGFAMVPTALAYVIGIGGCAAYNSALPISMQAETITLAGTMGKDIRERLSMLIFAGFTMAALGAFQVLDSVTVFAGDNVIKGMMAGVGIILTRVSLSMVKENKLVGIISIAVALVAHFLFNNLVYTIVACVVISSAVSYFIKGKVEVSASATEKKIRFHKPIINFNVIRGALALVCLTIGANIAFGNVTASFMNGQNANVDGLTVYSGLADAVSAMFGGAPVEAIISATASAPNPMWSGIIMMALMAIILVTGLLPKIAKFVPAQSIAGFLFVLGIFYTVVTNAPATFTGDHVIAGGLTMTVTAMSDPFIGLIAGLITKYAAPFIGLLAKAI